MRIPSVGRRKYAAGAVQAAAVGAALMVTGCDLLKPKTETGNFVPVRQTDATAGPPNPYIEVENIAVKDDIVQIVQFWPQIPFVKKSGIPVGMTVTTYFVSGETDRGAFVPGTIYAWLFIKDRDKPLDDEEEPAHVWKFDPDEAMNYRIRKLAKPGYGYGLILVWPNELDLEGKQIQIQLAYRRLNGTVVQAPRRDFEVPVGPNYRRRHAKQDAEPSPADPPADLTPSPRWKTTVRDARTPRSGPASQPAAGAPR